MASTPCEPACRPRPSTTRRPCAPTNPWPWWNALFDASRRSTCTCDRSITGWRSACALTCSCACSPIIWNGACARASPPCSTTTTKRPPRPCATAPSPRRNARPAPSPSRQQDEPPTESPSIASRASCRSGDPVPQHDRDRHRPQPTLHRPHTPHPDPAKSLPPPRHSHRLYPVDRPRSRFAVSKINGLRFAKKGSSV